MPAAPRMLDELVETIEIEIGEELAVQVANRQPLARLRAQQTLVRRHPRQLAGRALADITLGAIVKHQELSRPAGVVIGDVRFQ